MQSMLVRATGRQQMLAISRILMIVGVASMAHACGRDSRAATNQRVETPLVSPSSAACGHAACGNDFFVDIASVDGCAVGGRCAVSIKLVATGDYHINDAYPYKFKADETDGVEFLGADGTGRNVFSTFTGNWSKSDERTGAMTIAFKPSNPGTKALGGIFKLSVCSAENCQLESQEVKTTVTVR
jgi:hypothetical protein